MNDNKEVSDADIVVYTKAKMKTVHMVKSTEVEVEQYSNRKHKKLHETIRINAPDELQDNSTYKNATVGMIRAVSIKPS